IAAQGAKPDVAYVGTVDPDMPGLWIKGAMQERERRRFTGACCTDQRNRLTGQCRECQVHNRGAYEVVAERDIIELDAPLESTGVDGIQSVVQCRHRVEDLEELAKTRCVHGHPVR